MTQFLEPSADDIRLRRRKIFAFLYGSFIYIIGVWGILLYTVGFVGNYFGPIINSRFGNVFPWKSIDMGVVEPFWIALAINIGLLFILGLQHSGMARPTFKNWWTKIVPKHLERSTYIVVAIAALALLQWQWRPIPNVIWNVEDPFWRPALAWISFGGWLTVLYATILVGHWKVFGVDQVIDFLEDRPYTKAAETTPEYYKVGWPITIKGLWYYSRHPDFLGFIVAFWVTPTMTVGHLVFAIGLTIYIMIGIYFLERNLIKLWGPDYAEYVKTRSKIIPWFVRQRPISLSQSKTD
ncbi:methyltransferase family protein [Rhizobium sp. LEGMi135b]